MEEVFDFLKNKTKVNFVATINENKPSNRPFGDPVLFQNKIYVLTNKEKNISKQLKVNNNVCIVAYEEKSGNWIRINCELKDDSDNMLAKQAIMDEFDWAEGAGYTLDNQNFQVLYMENVEANIYDTDGNILAVYNF